MSLITVSKKRKRTYLRAFDHDLARALRKQGWNYTQLAQRFDVSPTAVRRVCEPAVDERMQAAALQWIKNNKREPCRGGCGRRVYTTREERSGYCISCRSELRSAVNVRPDELRCTKCGEWKPDDAFFKRAEGKRRRYRTHHCKVCSVAARRANRLANMERERARSRNYKRQKAAVRAARISSQ